MTDVRLHRTDRNDCARDLRTIRFGIAFIFAKSTRESRDFNRIAQRSSGTVRFDVSDGSRINLRAMQRFKYQIALRVRTRNGETIRRAAMIDRRTFDYAEDSIA